jgi:PAS domain S-box-containing protein
MDDREHIEELNKKINLLETQIKHLNNELSVVKEEYFTSTDNYFDLLSNLEKEVRERTKKLKETQLVLEAKGQELEIMLDSSPGMIFYKDKAQRYIRVNKKFVEITGIPMDEALGKTHSELYPGSTGQVLNDDSEVIQTGEPVLNKTGTLETMEGRKSLLVDKIPSKDRDGRVNGVIRKRKKRKKTCKRELCVPRRWKPSDFWRVVLPMTAITF